MKINAITRLALGAAVLAATGLAAAATAQSSNFPYRQCIAQGTFACYPGAVLPIPGTPEDDAAQQCIAEVYERCAHLLG